jgi:hypothetical protein
MLSFAERRWSVMVAPDDEDPLSRRQNGRINMTFRFRDYWFFLAVRPLTAIYDSLVLVTTSALHP